MDASITARPFFENCGFKVNKEQRLEVRGALMTNVEINKRLTESG
ncbi:GNAT family acetyltransferase [Rouxiella badensis]|uniref:GNAT family acetyltransferase n=1 Tax=Rouxiella badensis TaxID=1646377 RepID=A0A1X0WI71_9GAMM|nr:GNAT family acetyltransferase [Rouxiella badensis]